MLGQTDQTARQLCDLSNAVLLVAQADVVSLWSASRIRNFSGRERNPGRVASCSTVTRKFPDSPTKDVEKATTCKLLWKVPNNFQSVAPAIDKGSPVALRKQRDRPLISIAGRGRWRRPRQPARVLWICHTRATAAATHPKKQPAGS